MPATPTSEIIIFLLTFCGSKDILCSNGFEDLSSYHTGWDSPVQSALHFSNPAPNPHCSLNSGPDNFGSYSLGYKTLQAESENKGSLLQGVLCILSMETVTYSTPFLSLAHTPWKTSSFLHLKLVITMNIAKIFPKCVSHNSGFTRDQSNQIFLVR